MTCRGAAHHHTLHKTKLEPFKAWLAENQIESRPGKGQYQVLQVLTPADGWQVVFSKDEMPEHFTVNAKLMRVVRRFIRDSKRAKANAAANQGDQQ